MTSPAQTQLKDEVRRLLQALGTWGMSAVGNRLSEATERLTDYASNGGSLKDVISGGAEKLAEKSGGGGPKGGALAGAVKGMSEGPAGAVKGGVKGAAKGAASSAKKALPGGGGGGDGKGGDKAGVKVTTIIESIDVGVPVRVAYNQWTQYADFPKFTKGVEDVKVEEEEPEKSTWKAHVAFSHRTWTSTVTEQIPDKRIVWRSEGNKGYVDGAVTFHELAPDLTRILLVLEYHSQGFVEWVANRWRAAGRRARLDLKHFRRHVMTRTLLNPDEVEGWRGEIRDEEVVVDHETALRREREREEAEARDEDEEDREEPEGEEPEDEEPENEAEDEEPEGEEPEDEEAEDEEPEARGEDRAPERPRRRRRPEPEDVDEPADDEPDDEPEERPRRRRAERRPPGRSRDR